MSRKLTPLPDNAEQIVADMAAAGGKNRDIAFSLGIAERTLKRRFGPILTKRRADRRLGLARKQTMLALKGNVTMLIWLGTQLLGQQDVRINLTEIPDEVFQQEAERRLKLVGSS
jgi:DNA-binding CsgD family transcriptional regulator